VGRRRINVGKALEDFISRGTKASCAIRDRKLGGSTESIGMFRMRSN